MFFGLVIFVMLLATVVLWQSFRIKDKAQQKKLEAIRKKIERNENKKHLEKLRNDSKIQQHGKNID